ncbi:TetR/AcrR family transcriptional regulator [Paludisphaera mucosa]|uniref:Helix-turn-helix domain containing protein n=1 Tax=Paludisphaera mucosa TaxID=3030827 RepID=A0ABT6F5V8_9BACT|nr:TetR/AcrR family transcriptional regulator [Paludisphaera mucosa]MDG3002960.1 helix-turn-helix domain containing protein [Paludisphaera mucosa]
MSTTTRKQKEIRQREGYLLDVARKMLMEHGFSGLSMDRLAEATEYSKGTIYQHFSTKEDLVAALAVQSIEHRRELFERARKFDGRARERMFAIGVADELFGRLHPQYYKAEMVIRLANLQDRADVQRRKLLRDRDRECAGWVREIIEDAAHDGDLVLRTPWTAESLAKATFAIAVGTHLGLVNAEPLFEGGECPMDHACCMKRESVNMMLDGFGWRPLYTEWDYAATRIRVMETIFPDEWRIINGDQ